MIFPRANNRGMLIRNYLGVEKDAQRKRQRSMQIGQFSRYMRDICWLWRKALLLLHGFRRRDSGKTIVEICSLNYEGRTKREMEAYPWSPLLLRPGRDMLLSSLISWSLTRYLEDRLQRYKLFAKYIVYK